MRGSCPKNNGISRGTYICPCVDHGLGTSIFELENVCSPSLGTPITSCNPRPLLPTHSPSPLFHILKTEHDKGQSLIIKREERFHKLFKIAHKNGVTQAFGLQFLSGEA